MNNNYYVYLYLREDGTPYYVGKGKGNRAFRSNGRRMKPPSDKSKIIFHSENLTEDQAFALEKELIAKYGRKDNGTGILRNLTDGGEGLSGHILSDEVKAKAIARLHSPEVKAKREAALNTPEVKAKHKATMNRPEVKAKAIATFNRPEVKAKRKATMNTPEVKAKISQNNGMKIPEAKAKAIAALNTPEAKAKREAALNTPEAKAKRKEIMNRPEIRAKISASKKAYYAKKRLERSTSTANLEPFFIS